MANNTSPRPLNARTAAMSATAVAPRIAPDLIELANRAERSSARGVAFATVLARLAEFYSDGNERVDFGGEREAEFWHGVQIMMADVTEAIDDAAAVKKAAFEALRNGGAR